MRKSRHPKPVILITGIKGRLGLELSERLSDEFTVVGLDYGPAADAMGNTDYFEVDLTDDVSTVRGLMGLKRKYGDDLECVIHLATFHSHSCRPHSLYERLNVHGTRRLVHALRDFSVGQFVFVANLSGTSAQTARVQHDGRSQPPGMCDYSESIRQAERFVRQGTAVPQASVVKLAWLYDDCCHSIPLARQIAGIYERSWLSFVFPGDPECRVPFIHVDDATAALRSIVNRRQDFNPVEDFVIGEPQGIGYAELQDLIGQLLYTRKWPTVRIPAMAAKAAVWMRDKFARNRKSFGPPWPTDFIDLPAALNGAQARRRLAWNPRYRLRASLARMIESLREDPEQWYVDNGLSQTAPFPEKRPTLTQVYV